MYITDVSYSRGNATSLFYFGLNMSSPAEHHIRDSSSIYFLFTLHLRVFLFEKYKSVGFVLA